MLIPFSVKRKIFLTFRDIPKIGVLHSTYASFDNFVSNYQLPTNRNPLQHIHQ